MPFSCSALVLVTVSGGHIGMPKCKKSKRLHIRNIMEQSWINFNQWFLRYCHFCVNAILGTALAAILKGVFSFLFLKQLNARIILTQIRSKSIKHLLRYCHFHVCSIFSNGKWWPSWNAKLQKIKTTSYKKNSGTKLDQFQQMVLEILSFSCLCYF